ncbi:uncharacterized protein LOC119991561 [Tripterygium wilfordii]|uniref:uncharacterized protein LOC119991561 n=1 Tax=Tripterygium wilfordii TaxID=458696 RepID=UPI0018F8617F|nr:uncharacterized protein LOC119991561 [Tripterygium wilfordii]
MVLRVDHRVRCRTHKGTSLYSSRKLIWNLLIKTLTLILLTIIDSLSSSDFEFSEYIDDVYKDDHSSLPSVVSSENIGASSITGHSVATSRDTTMQLNSIYNLGRNFYKCVVGGCHAKKRVERAREDSSYVITPYEGKDSHESPGVVYDNQMSPNAWNSPASLQASSYS